MVSVEKVLILEQGLFKLYLVPKLIYKKKKMKIIIDKNHLL